MLLLVKCKYCGKNKPADHHGVVCKDCRQERAGKSPMYCVECGTLACRRHPSLCHGCMEKLSQEEITGLLIHEVENFPWDKLEGILAPLVEEYELDAVLTALSGVTGSEIVQLEAGQIVTEGE